MPRTTLAPLCATLPIPLPLVAATTVEASDRLAVRVEPGVGAKMRDAR